MQFDNSQPISWKFSIFRATLDSFPSPFQSSGACLQCLPPVSLGWWPVSSPRPSRASGTTMPAPGSQVGKLMDQGILGFLLLPHCWYWCCWYWKFTEYEYCKGLYFKAVALLVWVQHIIIVLLWQTQTFAMLLYKMYFSNLQLIVNIRVGRNI